MVQSYDRRVTVASDPRATWFPVSVDAGADARKKDQLIARSQKAVTMSHRDPTASRTTAPTTGATPSDHEAASGLQIRDGRLPLDRHGYEVAADPRQVRADKHRRGRHLARAVPALALPPTEGFLPSTFQRRASRPDAWWRPHALGA
jgi:hypothetical protein